MGEFVMKYKLKKKFSVKVAPIFGTCPKCGSKDDFTHGKQMRNIICNKCDKKFPVSWVA